MASSRPYKTRLASISSFNLRRTKPDPGARQLDHRAQEGSSTSWGRPARGRSPSRHRPRVRCREAGRTSTLQPCRHRSVLAKPNARPAAQRIRCPVPSVAPQRCETVPSSHSSCGNCSSSSSRALTSAGAHDPTSTRALRRGRVFGDPRRSPPALLDRLPFITVVIRSGIQSYRLRQHATHGRRMFALKRSSTAQSRHTAANAGGLPPKPKYGASDHSNAGLITPLRW